MPTKREPYLQFRQRIMSRFSKQKNDQKLKCPPQKDQGKEENFQNLFNYYLNLINLNVLKYTKEGDNLDQISVKRVNAFMNPYQFKYLAKALLKIPQINVEYALQFQSAINFFRVHFEKSFSPHFSPSLLNNLSKFQENLHNCESLNKNNYFIKNLSLTYDTQLRSDEVPFLLIKESEFMKDVDDKENKLKGMICGLANHRGGYIICCQSFAKNRITGGLKEITNTFIDNIKFKLEIALSAIVRKGDIGIEVQRKILKSLKYKTDEEDTEQEYVILIHVKINRQNFSNGFYIERKKHNELYKQQLQLQNKCIQQLKNKYKKIISEICKKFPNLQIKSISTQLSEKNIQPLKRLFWEQCENEWVCKEVKEYEKIREIMKFNFRREVLDFQWKQKFFPGITLKLKQIRVKSMESVQIKLHQNEDHHLRQICHYFVSREQSKKEIAQFFSQIPKQYSVGLIVHGQMIEMSTINKILQGILKMSKTSYKIVVPFPKLQQKIGQFRKQKTKAHQNYCYYVSFKGHYQELYDLFKKQLDKYDIKQVTMEPVKVKSKVGSFLMSEDAKILQKTIKHFFNVEPVIKMVLNCKQPLLDSQYRQKLQQSPCFKQQIQKDPQKFFKFKQIDIDFKENELNASLLSYILLFLARKRPKPSLKI